MGRYDGRRGTDGYVPGARRGAGDEAHDGGQQIASSCRAGSMSWMQQDRDGDNWEAGCMDNRPGVHLLIADGSQEDRRREGGTGGQRRAAGCRTADGGRCAKVSNSETVLARHAGPTGRTCIDWTAVTCGGTDLGKETGTALSAACRNPKIEVCLALASAVGRRYAATA